MSGSCSALRHSRVATAFVILTLILAVLPLSQIAPPVAAQDTATYTLTKYNCNPGYDLSSGDANAAFSNCTSPGSGVTFTLQSGDASYGNNGAQQTNGSGSVSWSGIPLGSGYSVVESIPSGGGDPWVYCEISGNPNNPGDVQRSFFQASGGNMDVGYSDPNLTSYTQATCYWFNPTADQGQQGQQGQQVQGSGYATVHIQKYLCDQSYDYSSSNYADYTYACTDAHKGVQLSVNGGNPSSTSDTGVVEFNSLPAGEAKIRLYEPSGYIPIALYCVDWDQSQSGSPTLSDSNTTTWTGQSDGSYEVTTTLTDYHTYYCYWFDIPSSSGTVYLYKFYCDPSFDWQSNGYDYLLSECTAPQSDVPFQIENGSYSQEQTTDDSGTAIWSDVPDGTLSITESAPSGYQVGRIFCGYSDTNSSAPTDWDEYSYSDGWDVPTQTGKYLFCVIFDVPTTTTWTIYLYKYYCEPSFDWQNGGFDYLYSGCTNEHSDVMFDLSSGSYSESQTTGTDGTATWSNVPEGDWHFEEQFPSGYQIGRIFCGWTDDNSSTPSSWDEYTYSSGWDIPQSDVSGQYLYCVIFDVPTTNTTVYIYKYYCDASFDWENGGYDYLSSGCQNPQENVTFDLSTGGGYSQSQTTDTSGYASWSDVPQDNMHFDEQLPDGYQIGRIFCGWSDSDSSFPTSWDEYTYSSGWDVPSDSHQYLYCDIFDIPTDYGWVTFYKYYCEADFDWQSGGYDDLYSGCTSPQADVEFSLDSGSYSQSQTTDSSGMAQWTDVPGSSWHFDEQFPDGYQIGRIFCGWSDSDSSAPNSWDEYTYSSGWDISSSSGQYWYCYIFDVPTTYGWVTFYKYYCEADFDWQNGGYDYLKSGCTSPHSDVEFTLDSGSYSESRTTDSSGVASWIDVPGSDWHFDEQFPDGYQIGRIFCGWSDSDSSEPTSWDEYDYSSGWDISSSSGEYWYCYIFDVPTTYGWVTFYKYYCDADFDWENGGYDYLYGECTSPQPDVEFTIESGSYSESQITDSSGIVQWSAVPGYDWHFSESVPDGYQVGRIFCGWSDSESSQPTSWDEYTYSDGWNISSSDGEYWYCYIFDVPTTYGWVTIYKYYCDSSYDWQSSSYDDLYSDCSSAQADVEFDLSSGSYSESQTTDSSGMAQWSDVPGSSWHFEEHFPDGYQVGRIFCGWSDSDSSEPTSWDEYDYSSGWDISSSPEQYWYCYVFDVPTTYGWVTIYKYNCPSDFDASSSDPSYYDSSCTEQPEGVEFELSNSSYGYSDSQNTDSSGTVSWIDVPSGSGWGITEHPDGGYAPIAVWCGTTTDGSDPTSWDQYTLASDGSVGGLTVEPETYLFCVWFNKPYDNPQVWIYKYNCDSSADWHWNYHQLLSGCTDPAPNVAFAYAPQGGDPSESTTDDQGRAFYDSLDPGTWSWEETYPSGYDGAVVYCQWVNYWGSGEYQLAQLDGSKLWLDVQPGDVVTCYWFDFPTGYGPSSGGGNSSGGNTSGGNTSGGNTSGGNTSGGTGGNAGNTSGGTGGAGGNGGTGGPPPLTSNAPTGPTGGGQTGGSGGTTGQQTDPNAPATLVITKSTCPEGYDLYGEDADVAEDCTELTEDIDFALTSLTPQVQNGTPVPNEPVTQTTDVDGVATWSNLKAGPYLIQETMPEGTDSAFIWTCKSDKRQFQTQYPLTPFSYAGPNGQTGITLIGGEKLECSWYDVPAGQASVTIQKFECPSSPVIVAQCNPAGAGVAFSLTPAEGSGAIVQLSTDDSGTASGSGAPGAYILAEQGGTPCLIDSDAVDAQGHVSLAQNQTAEIKVYNCGGGS